MSKKSYVLLTQPKQYEHQFDLYFYSFEKGQQLQNFLLQLRLEKLPAPRQSCVIKGHMSFLILNLEQELNIQMYSNRILEQVNKLNLDEHKLPILRIMIDALEKICDTNSNIFEFGSFVLIGNATHLS